MARELLLREILDPISEAAFLAIHWAREPLVLKRSRADQFDGLFDLDDLEAFLFTARPPLGEFELVKGGKPPPAETLGELFGDANYDVQRLYDALNGGYTIVLNAVHHRWPPVRRLVTDLEDQLRAAGQANVYVTRQSARGFAPHVDDHDVFVLQTHGSKRWWIYDEPTRHPGRDRPPLLHDVVIEQGDTLYIPQGFPHFAEATDDFSIHITVGIFRYTWFKLFTDLVHAAAAEDPSWHEPLPMAALDGSDVPPMAAVRRKLAEGLARIENTEFLLERYHRWLASPDRRKSAAPGGYLRSLAAAPSIGAETPLVRRHGVACFVTTSGRSAAIHFLGAAVTAPRRAERALRFVAAERGFTPSALPGLSEPSQLVLVRRLVREGLLQVAG